MPGWIKWDVYTVVMVAMIPAILLVAWGLEWWEDHSLHQTQCALAEQWLEDSEVLATQFEIVNQLGRTDPWITSFEELESPAKAGQLRWGILQSARYFKEYYPEMSTTEPGVLNPPDGINSRDIVNGTKELIEHCPDVESMLPKAFPMVFTKDESQ